MTTGLLSTRTVVVTLPWVDATTSVFPVALGCGFGFMGIWIISIPFSAFTVICSLIWFVPCFYWLMFTVTATHITGPVELSTAKTKIKKAVDIIQGMR
jgi:hypothetical protein